jgi:hypothetical protein
MTAPSFAPFEYAADVLVLQQVVRKIILRECRNAADPNAVLAEWQDFLALSGGFFRRAGAEGGGASTEHVSKIVTAFDEFSENLAADFEAGF